jgi:hypothetical protein
MAGAGFYPQKRENNLMPMQSGAAWFGQLIKITSKTFVINSSYAIFL